METRPGDRVVMEGATYPLDRDIYAIAVAQGLLAVVADDYMLQVDWDHPEYNRTEAQITAENILQEHVGVTASIHTRSKSGNIHVYFFLTTPLDLASRVAFQAALGSDPKREALGVLRVLKKIESPVAFFEKPEEYERVMELKKDLHNEIPF